MLYANNQWKFIGDELLAKSSIEFKGNLMQAIFDNMHKDDEAFFFVCLLSLVGFWSELIWWHRYLRIDQKAWLGIEMTSMYPNAKQHVGAVSPPLFSVHVVHTLVVVTYLKNNIGTTSSILSIWWFECHNYLLLELISTSMGLFDRSSSLWIPIGCLPTISMISFH